MGNCLTCIRSLFSWARSDSQSAIVANDVSTTSSTHPLQVTEDKETQQLLCQPAAPLTTESSEPNESHTSDVLLSVVTQIDGKPYTFSKLGALDQPTVVAAKPTGSALKGSAFAIVECANAILLLLDWSSQITVDLCKGCLIFVGPCDGSVFIRDCSDCTIFVIGRQVRFRDCSKCYIYIHSATPPALETSRDMSFRVFQGSYERLQEHFNSANLEVYTNQWARVHDFSPPSDTTLPPNFALQPSESSWAPAQVHLPPTIHKDLVDKLGSVPILSGLNLSTVSVPMTRPAQQVSVVGTKLLLVVAVVRLGYAHRFARLAKVWSLSSALTSFDWSKRTLTGWRPRRHDTMCAKGVCSRLPYFEGQRRHQGIRARTSWIRSQARGLLVLVATAVRVGPRSRLANGRCISFCINSSPQDFWDVN